jgi:hypothetical protein
LKSSINKLLPLKRRPGVSLLTCAGLLLASCGGAGSEDVVVSYKDNALTRKMLAHNIPEGAKGEDSTRFATQAVQQWMLDQSVMDYALELDPELSERIAYKVEDYRAELIKHEFHTRLIEDSLSAVVDAKEIDDYYEKNKQHFRGKENMYCYFYIMTSQDDVGDAADWMRSNSYNDILKLREWARQNAIDYKVDSLYVNESIIGQVAKGYYGDLKNAGNGKLIRWNGVIQGERRKYLFKMIDFIENGAPLPLHLCRDKIRGLVMNERKVALIDRNDKRILDNARANNYIREE